MIEKLKRALAELVGPEEEAPLAIEGEEAAKVEAKRGPGLLVTDYKARGFHLDLQVDSSQVVAAAEILDSEKFFIEAVTGVDWLAEQELEVVYDFSHFHYPCRVVVRTRLPRAKPEVATISGIYPGANWHERETHDFFGITFLGHPDLSPLLLPEDADFHPLLKDFKA